MRLVYERYNDGGSLVIELLTRRTRRDVTKVEDCRSSRLLLSLLMLKRLARKTTTGDRVVLTGLITETKNFCVIQR